MALFSFTWLLLPFESITSPQLYILPPSLFIGITFIDTEGGSIFHFPRKIKLKMNPIVKVRAQDDQFSPRNDTGLLLFLRTIDTLSMQGTMKNNFKHVSTNSKSNVRANSVLRPRAVLSSPANILLLDSLNWFESLTN
ncbi:hypothetical protein I3842_03G260000 [Carya illinoinensis]|uniref:Uncharacterized protein n=1 Tax=Carya illinoinensis TaxID=32201 RepID=A0A922JXC1_CARIL|nr:hypothetical protein I3842_03G260000 [Carya illinoinensis]